MSDASDSGEMKIIIVSAKTALTAEVTAYGDGSEFHFSYAKVRHYRRLMARGSRLREIQQNAQKPYRVFIRQSKTNRQERLTCNKWVSGHYP